jgi:uncharacterized protein (TIGR02266 family)
VGNLSEGGLFLQTSSPLERGSRTKLRLELQGDGEFQVEGTVVWARFTGSEAPAGMGLQFEALDTAAREKLRRLVEAELGRERSRAPEA